MTNLERATLSGKFHAFVDNSLMPTDVVKYSNGVKGTSVVEVATCVYECIVWQYWLYEDGTVQSAYLDLDFTKPSSKLYKI